MSISIMCWESLYIPILLVAKKEVPIFKITNNNLSSYYQDFQYELNKEYSMELEDPSVLLGSLHPPVYRIFKGFHSYSPRKIKIHPTYMSKFVAIGDYPVLEVCNIDTTIKVIGYLPVGTKYYINKMGEIVSDKIVLTKTESLVV